MSVCLGGGAHVSDAKAAFPTCPVKVLKLKSELPLSGGGSGAWVVRYYDPKLNQWCVKKTGLNGESIASEAKRAESLGNDPKLGMPAVHSIDLRNNVYCMAFISGSLLRDFVCLCNLDRLESLADKLVDLIRIFESYPIVNDRSLEKIPNKTVEALDALDSGRPILEKKIEMGDILHGLMYTDKDIEFPVELMQTMHQCMKPKWRTTNYSNCLVMFKRHRPDLWVSPVNQGHGDLTWANIIVDHNYNLRPIDARPTPGNCTDEEKAVWPGSCVVDGSVYIDKNGELHDPDNKLKTGIQFSQVLQTKLGIKTYNAIQFIRDIRVAVALLKQTTDSEKIINRIRTDLILYMIFDVEEKQKNATILTSYTMR